MDPGLKNYLRQFQDWTKSYCAPVFFRNEHDERRNGSMTFVETAEEVLGITAGHVADRLIECCDGKHGHGCQVGAAEMDLNRFIARHPSLDIATFRLSHQFLAAAGHYAISISDWPPRPPSEGEKVLIGGYPGIYRLEEDEENQIDVSFTHFGVRVSSASETKFWMTLGISNADSITGDHLAPNIDLGGVSSGGVFRVIEDELIARPELAGILAGGSAEFEATFGHPLTCLKADGTMIG
jgi:hypothetical protein